MIRGPLWHRGGVPDDDTITEESRRTGLRDRSPLTWTVAIAGVVVIAGAVLFLLLNRGDDEPVSPLDGASATEDVSRTELVVDAESGRCLPPSVTVLQQQEVAFDGVVRSIAGGLATLEPSHFYAGDPTDIVVVKAPGGELQALLAAVDFEEGDRYLVAASDGRVAVCGLSARYSQELAALYDEAFGG